MPLLGFALRTKRGVHRHRTAHTVNSTHTQAQAGMDLLLDRGQDVLRQQIFRRLTPTALARLASTSKQLLSLVKNLTESTWRACAAQTLHRCDQS